MGLDTVPICGYVHRADAKEADIVEYRGLMKKLDLPRGYAAPAELAYEDLRARALSRADLKEDVKGVNSSIELIRNTRGGPWPAEPVTEHYDYADLVWHEVEFREGDSFAYAVYDTAERYLGCCYLYPLGRRTPLTQELLSHDVDVSWWVTPVAYERSYYEKLYAALQYWIDRDFPFQAPFYSNVEIPRPDRGR